MGLMPTDVPLIFDGHNDTVLSLDRTGRSFFERSTDGHIDLPRARAGGLGGGFFAVYLRDPAVAARTGSGEMSDEVRRRVFGDERTWPEPMPLDYAQSHAIDLLGRLLRIADASGGQVQVVRTAAELQQHLTGGIFAMLLHFEGAEPLDPEGAALDVFYAAGLRSVGLTHSRRNRYCQGVPIRFPSSPDLGPGLTDLGKTLVRQLNARRVMIDLSHLNERGFWDVAALSDAPLVATHSNAHALCPNPRNLTDRQLDAIRDSHGVVGAVYACGFLRADGKRDTNTPLTTLVDHIDYLVRRMGIDHVALGSDFDGTMVPTELHDAGGLPRVASALRARGYEGSDLQKLLHGNWVRVLRETWGA